MIDLAAARETMVESQLLTDRVRDRRVLAAFGAVPRELFVPADRRNLAYSDGALEVWPSIEGGPARYLLAPLVLARLVQLAAVEAGDAVLDIGCTTGYSTSILAALADSVTAVEVEPELAAAARANLRMLGVGNAKVIEGDLAEGAPEAGPFDVILLNGSVPDMPDGLAAQLKEGGRLVGVVTGGSRERPRQGKAVLFVKVDGEASGLPHFDANARPLPGFAKTPSFTF
jgi:protein-L-isoaspartate(D-aspartate) O-methyltransferase